MYMRNVLFVVAGILAVLVMPAYAQAFLIDGDTVYVGVAGKGVLSQTPYMLTGFTNTPNITFTSLLSSDKCIDVAFGFDTDVIKPVSVDYFNPSMFPVQESYTCDNGKWYNYTTGPLHLYCWNNLTYLDNSTMQYYENPVLVFEHDFETYNFENSTVYWTEYEQIAWQDITDRFDSVEYGLLGNDRWYYVHFNISPLETKTIQPTIWIDAGTQTSGKYDILMKFCEDSLSEAYASGRYVLLDPWWDAGWSYRRYVNGTNPNAFALNQTSFEFNITGTDIQSDCGDVRVIYRNETAEIPYDLVQATATNCTIRINDDWNPSATNDYWVYYGTTGATTTTETSISLNFINSSAKYIDALEFNNHTAGDTGTWYSNSYNAGDYLSWNKTTSKNYGGGQLMCGNSELCPVINWTINLTHAVGDYWKGIPHTKDDNLNSDTGFFKYSTTANGTWTNCTYSNNADGSDEACPMSWERIDVMDYRFYIDFTEMALHQTYPIFDYMEVQSGYKINDAIIGAEESGGTSDTAVPGLIDFVLPTLSNGSITPSNYVEINVSFNETSPDTCLIEISNGSTANWTGAITGTDESAYCWFNASNDGDGDVIFLAWINDTSGNSNQSATRTITVDNSSYPVWYGQGVDPATGSDYPQDYIEFNISWIENTYGMDKAWILHNISGTWQMYFMSNYSTSYTYKWTYPPAGTFTFAYYSNNTHGNTNTTENMTYTIDKLGTAMHIAINGTEASQTFNYGNWTNVSAWTTTTGTTGVTLLMNLTGTSNPEIGLLGPDLYNYTANYSHQNYTICARLPCPQPNWELIINKKPTGLSLSASPGWNIYEDTQITVTCSALSEFSTVMYLDGSIVSSPYNATLPVGAYNFTCISNGTTNTTPNVAQHDLTVSEGVSGCTGATIYAFSKNFTKSENYTSFDFGTMVTSGFVKPDLSDVYSGTDNITLYVNYSGGYYVTANLTAVTENYTMEWGNYYNNNTYNTSATYNFTNLTGYSQANDYYVFTVVDEFSEAQSLPAGANKTTITVYCANGSSTATINHTHFIVATSQTATEGWFNVYYPADQYFRSYILGGSAQYKTVYLADATTYTILQIPIEMMDVNYWANTYIKLYKLGGSGELIITEGIFDATHIFNAYLTKDERYYIRIQRSTQTIDIGFLYAVSSGTQQISVASVTLEPTIRILHNYITIGADINASGVLKVQYYDATNDTESIRFQIYEETNQSTLFDNTYNWTNNLTISINGLNTSKRYGIKYTLYHGEFGNSPITGVFGAGMLGTAVAFGLASWVYNAISLIVITLSSFILGLPRVRMAGYILLGVLIGMFYYVGWLTMISMEVMAIIVIFLGLGVVYEVKRGGLR